VNGTMSQYQGRWGWEKYDVIITMMSIRNNGTAFLTLDNMKTLDVTSPYTLLETTGNYWIGKNDNSYNMTCFIITHHRGS